MWVCLHVAATAVDADVLDVDVDVANAFVVNVAVDVAV